GKGHGVFFHYVIEGFKGKAKNRSGSVSWNSLVDYVTEMVSDEAPKLLGEAARQPPHEIRNMLGKSPVLANPGFAKPAEVPIAACRKIGGAYGRFVPYVNGWLMFKYEQKEEGLPGFRFIRCSDQTLARLPKIGVPFGLILTFTQVTDEGMKHLADCKQLRILWVASTAITDKGLQHLGKCQDLQSLSLDRTKVSDEGLKHLGRIKHLHYLALSGCKGVSDKK